MEHHDAFEVRYLDEVAQHGERPDYSVVTVEIKNKLPVVSGSPETSTYMLTASACLPVEYQLGLAEQRREWSLL